jgi:hypothetical protein
MMQMFLDDPDFKKFSFLNIKKYHMQHFRQGCPTEAGNIYI